MQVVYQLRVSVQLKQREVTYSTYPNKSNLSFGNGVSTYTF